MALKIVIFAAFAAVAHAGVIEYQPHQPHHYSDATAVSYSSVSAPSEAAYNAATSNKYVAPVVKYAAPAIKYAAPVVKYAAPAIKYAAPEVKYAAPAIQYAAPVVKYAAPVAYAASEHEEEHYAPAHYEFGYSVHDPHTGDIKEQHESREGDIVKGSYSFVEADGTKRIVEYTADKHNGFNAVVHREGTPIVKTAEPLVAKYSAPLVAKVSSPVSYAAPVAKFAYAAPSHDHYYH